MSTEHSIKITDNSNLQSHCQVNLKCHLTFAFLRKFLKKIDKDRGSNPSRSTRFYSPKRPDRLWGPPSLLLNGYRVSFPRVKWPLREVNHSPPSSAEVKNKWSYTSTPPICIHGVDRENFNFVGRQNTILHWENCTRWILGYEIYLRYLVTYFVIWLHTSLFGYILRSRFLTNLAY